MFYLFVNKIVLNNLKNVLNMYLVNYFKTIFVLKINYK